MSVRTQSSRAASDSWRWKDYRRFIEDDSYWLLYHNNRFYRIFPKRAFQQQQASEFNRLIANRLGVQEA
ncbi:MAG TPA: YcxB family protein [Candidatus Angelobacter sp.]